MKRETDEGVNFGNAVTLPAVRGVFIQGTVLSPLGCTHNHDGTCLIGVNTG